MSIRSFQTPEEILAALGERLRRHRLNLNLDQKQTAERAGVSVRALRSLEAGKGSQLATFIRILKSLDALGRLDALAPVPTVSPMAILERGHEPQRASRPRRRPGGAPSGGAQ